MTPWQTPTTSSPRTSTLSPPQHWRGRGGGLWSVYWSLPPCKRLILRVVWSVWSLAAPLQAALVAHAFIVGPRHSTITTTTTLFEVQDKATVFFSHFLITELDLDSSLELELIATSIFQRFSSLYNLLIFRQQVLYIRHHHSPSIGFLSCLGLKVLCENFLRELYIKYWIEVDY